MEQNNKKISLAAYIISLLFMLIIIIILVFIIIRQNATENYYNQEEIEQDTQNTDYIVLYRGLEIDKKIGIQNLTFADITEDNKDKYNIKYYNYEKNEYKGEVEGIFGKEEAYEGTSYVENVNTFAISKKYDAMPRTSSKITEIPIQLKDMMDNNNIEIETIDLNGDGKNEHIVVVQHTERKEDYDTDKNEAYSEIILFDSNYNKIDTLAKWTLNFEMETEISHLDLSDIIYIDLDNDKIMEIVIQIPSYEGWKISILKYNGNNIEGETDYEVNVIP